jgi:F-box-like
LQFNFDLKSSEMNVSAIARLNELDEDVLHMIFQQLEGEDLVNCENVCRQWRDILLAGTPWRRLFDRNKDSSPLWRRAQRILESNQLT